MSKTFRFMTFLISGMVLFYPLSAQEPEPPPAALSGSLSLALSLNRGNSDLTNGSVTLKVEGRPAPRLEWLNSGFFLFGEAEGQVNSETYQLASRLNWQHSDRLFSYAEIQGTRDRFKNLGHRIVPALGVGTNLVQSDKISLGLSGGVTGVFTRYYDTGTSDSYLGLTFGNQLVWKISQSADFQQKWDWNFDAGQFEHYLSNLEASLTSALVNNLSVKFTFLNRYDSRPQGEGVKKNDVSFLAGISMKF